MTRAILTCFHKYQPYSGEFYQPIFDYFISNLSKYKDEYDQLYLIDSNWNIPESDKYKIIKVNSNLRYYDAYKEVLPQVKEDFLLLMDNDMVIYKPAKIQMTFNYLDEDALKVNGRSAADVVSIYDSCGDYKTDKLNGKNKFCPYLFATRKELLMKYLDIDWGSHMPESETLGYLTKAMLDDGIRPYEMPEDKNNIYFNGVQDGEKSKDLGYYHIRAGSTPAWLLTEKKYGNYKSYEDYMVSQPRQEYLRQIAWYYEMTDVNKECWMLRPKIQEIFKDIHISDGEWLNYMDKFKKYHGL